MTVADMTTDDLEYAVSQGIYGDDRMTARQLDAACAALTELVRRLEAADAIAAERAAIAAYLRAEANRRVEALERADRRCFVMAYASIHRWADAIERGGHIVVDAIEPGNNREGGAK